MKNLISEIKKFNLYDLLEIFSFISIEMFLENKFLFHERITKHIGMVPKVYNQFLTSWDLLRLSHIALLNSKDYILSNKPNYNDIMLLKNLLLDYDESNRKKIDQKLNNKEIIDHIFIGHTFEQIWFQDILRHKKKLYDFLRNYIILLIVPNNINLDQTFTNNFSIGINEFIEHMFIIFTYVKCKNPIIDINKLFNEFNINEKFIKKDKLMICIQNFSEKVIYYRNDDKNNRLIHKPIVCTNNNNYIISNVFLLLQKLNDGVYWLIRDFYKNKNSKEFLIEFGDMFENYVKLLLQFYLNPNKFEKLIPNNKNKIADWIITTDKYIIIVEQKSTLLRNDVKNKLFDLFDLDSGLSQFVKSFEQIEQTIIQKNLLDHNNVIKVTLHYEKIFQVETNFKDRLLKQINKKPNTIIGHYYLINIDEFELLIQVLSENEEIFNKIIEHKIKNETDKPIHEGNCFKDIIVEYYDVKDIKFLESYKYIYDEISNKIFND